MLSHFTRQQFHVLLLYNFIQWWNSCSLKYLSWLQVFINSGCTKACQDRGANSCWLDKPVCHVHCQHFYCCCPLAVQGQKKRRGREREEVRSGKIPIKVSADWLVSIHHREETRISCAIFLCFLTMHRKVSTKNQWQTIS